LKVSIEEIKSRNYNLDINHPLKTGNNELKTPKELIKELERNVTKSIELLQSMKEILGEDE